MSAHFSIEMQIQILLFRRLVKQAIAAKVLVICSLA